MTRPPAEAWGPRGPESRVDTSPTPPELQEGPAPRHPTFRPLASRPRENKAHLREAPCVGLAPAPQGTTRHTGHTHPVLRLRGLCQRSTRLFLETVRLMHVPPGGPQEAGHASRVPLVPRPSPEVPAALPAGWGPRRLGSGFWLIPTGLQAVPGWAAAPSTFQEHLRACVSSEHGDLGAGGPLAARASPPGASARCTTRRRLQKADPAGYTGAGAGWGGGPDEPSPGY